MTGARSTNDTAVIGGGAGSPEEIAPILRGKISLEAWLTERADNCARIVLVKTGADQRGWLEDEAYFRAAIKAIRDARARALDEAAKVADARVWADPNRASDVEYGRHDAAQEIASAIRSLKAQP